LFDFRQDFGFQIEIHAVLEFFKIGAILIDSFF